jgi:hypothetical protein
MNRRIPILATAAAVLITALGIAPAQAEVPDISAISASPTTIYPLINNAKRPGITTITVTGIASTVAALEIRNAADVKVRDLNLAGQNTVTWNGRDNSSAVVPGGSYKIVAIGSGSDVSAVEGAVTVSGQKLVHKTYTKTVTAAYSLAYKFVGKCSTLRKPSKRKWKGSLGFYANAKCKKQTWNASAVSTQHVLRLPAAEQYTDMRVNTYGGAHKRGSRGLIRYFPLTGNKSVSDTFISSKVGNHTGPLRKTTNMVSANHWISWGFVTAYKSQYDVKSFTVVVHYDVLG